MWLSTVELTLLLLRTKNNLIRYFKVDDYNDCDGESLDDDVVMAWILVQ